MKKSNLIFGSLLLLLCVACNKQQENIDDQRPQEVIRFVATMDADQATDTRVALINNGATKSLVTRWKEGDEVALYVKQGGKYFAGDKVKVKGISPDGKQCAFDMPIPNGVKSNEQMEVIGVCGTQSRLVNTSSTASDNGVYVQISPHYAPIEQAKVAIWFTQVINGSANQTISILFKHIGAYEVVHLKNETAGTISVQSPMLSATTPWYHPKGTNHSYMNLQSGVVKDYSGTDYSAPSVSISGRATHLFVNWYVPNTKNMSKAILRSTIEGADVATSATKSSAKPLLPGNAYNIYATWDGKYLTFTDAQGVGGNKIPLMVSTAYIRIVKGTTALLGITSGNGAYECSMANSNIAKVAKVEGNTIYIEGLSLGETVLSIKDKVTQEEAKVKVTVYEQATPSVGIEWIEVPSGSFMMGSPEGEGGDDERPQHKVSLSAFRISKYEVTFDQYDAFCEATGREKPSDDGWGRGSRPVINVSWHDAKAFCNWLGNGTRLPTEAEWEYACRAGSTTKYSFGDEINSNDANYGSAGIGKTTPVGSFPANAWGIHDMHGNVWEWCEDWYSSTYYSYSLKVDPKGDPSGSSRVYRGGSWSYGADYCRSAYRNHTYPDHRYNNLGFRVVSPSL